MVLKFIRAILLWPNVVLDAMFSQLAYNRDCRRVPMAEMTTTAVRTQGFYLQGKWKEEGTPVEIRSPYDGAPIAQVFQGTREHAEKAIQAAVGAFRTTRKLPVFERQRILRSNAQYVTSRKGEFASTLGQEAGKPIRAARTEVERSIFTFTIAAEESA
jgi:acyl-CoA reductase-like NAD-dependent aldehyde dehydrogenase